LIYPGDVLVLDRNSGRLSIERADQARMSPRVRTDELTKAVPTIPPSVIQPFITRPMVVGANELDSAPEILATDEARVVVGAGDIAYAKGLNKEQGANWHIYRRGDRLIDPDTGTT
jgi:hypothetical protein